MASEGYVCRECREPVAESAQRCPHCGYTPAKSPNRKKWLYGVVGFVLTMTVIGAPIGLPLLFVARRGRKKAESASPAVQV